MLLVDALKTSYLLAELLVRVELPRSSYFDHQARQRAPEKYVQARLTLSEVFERNHRCYGYRRMQVALNQEQVNLSEKVVRRLMKQEHLEAASPKRRRYGSYQGEIDTAPENLINRDFKA